MSRFYTSITDELAQYIRQVTLREPEALRKLREETENHPRASCQISPEQGQFLNLLARLTSAVFAVVFGGAATLFVVIGAAAGIPELRKYGRLDGHDVPPEEPQRQEEMEAEAKLDAV